jgi:hypothetical protein
MIWSLNELESEARKAIRGAGLPWGLAEEGGKAVRWLAAYGIDPLPALADVLERHDRRARITSVIKITEAGRRTADAPLCPIILGTMLCDDADRLATNAFVAGPVARPLLLAPFVAAAAHILGRPLQFEVEGRQIVLDRRGDPSGDLAMLDVPGAADIRCASMADRVSGSPGQAAATHGIAADPQSWQRIAAYGHRTYVPASERSRREGAGAGLIDND